MTPPRSIKRSPRPTGSSPTVVRPPPPGRKRHPARTAVLVFVLLLLLFPATRNIGYTLIGATAGALIAAVVLLGGLPPRG